MSSILEIGRMYFNSQPRKGADNLMRGLRDPVHISTHSPARGLTPYKYDSPNSFIFQLTAPQGG